MLDANKVKKDFPLLSDPSIVYLDNAATTQKPKQVIDAITEYYARHNANPHRSAHRLGILSTEAFESARKTVQNFIGAKSSEEIVFTKSTTESLNLLGNILGKELKSGDEILITIQEHHANLVTWQECAKCAGAKLVYAYLNEDLTLNQSDLLSKVNKNTKIVSFTQASNVTGAICDCYSLIRDIRKKTDATIIVDGAQSLPHMQVNVNDMDCDFFVASGHKLLAPMGIGLLYGKAEKLNTLSPFLFGGDMIEYVYEQNASYLSSPFKYEAGTQNVCGAVGFARAIDYLNSIGMEAVHSHEKELIDYAFERFSAMQDVTLYTSPKEKTAVLSFNLEGAHPHDIATILDAEGVMIRSGHHCAQPLHRYLKKPFSARASFYIYNTLEDVDKLIESIQKVRKVLKLGT